MADYDVIVIGAGLGGISAGALLAKQGRKTLVLEQADHIGGCCSTFEKEGYKFDVGASIVEIIQPIEQTFRELDTTFQNEVELIPCDPMMSFINEDGSRVTYPLSAKRTGEIIAGMSAEDGGRWNDFVDYCQELMEVSLDTVFAMPANDLGDMVAMVRKNPRLVKFLPAFLNNYQDVIQRFFKNEQVLKTMGYQSLYFGLPPMLVPGAYAMVPYTEHTGIYYPRGGMIQIPEAFRRVGEKFGLQVRLNSLVNRIIVRNGRAVGVRLSDGTEISARIIVSNINAKVLYMKMIGIEYLPPVVRRGVESYRYSISVPMVYVGVDYEPPLEAHHSVIAATPEELNRHWQNHMLTGKLANEPFGLICWPSHSDSTLAPKGRHVLNLIPEGVYHLDQGNWDDIKEEYIDTTLRSLSKTAVPGLIDHVKVVECATPLDLERRLLLPEGAIYCLQQDLTAMTVFRPASKSKAIQGLYLTGSSTHPGGGVPTTIASGLIASHLIDRCEY